MSKNKTIEEIAKEDEEFLATWGESPQEEKKEEFIPKTQYFTAKQLKRQTIKIVEFLKLIKPHLGEDYYVEGATELRPIKRDKEDKTYLRSFNTFHLLEKDVVELEKFMSAINGHGFCLYYSTFDFDRNLEIAANKQKNTIKNENALYTTILPMDLDNCTEAEYGRIKGILKTLDIETVDVMSGHGYQLIILLDSKIYDKEILKKFTTLIRSKGIDADEAVGDPARVMRLPFTFNCKCFDPKFKQYKDEEPVPIKLINTTSRRYNLFDVFKKINTLSDVVTMSEKEKDNQNDITLKTIKFKLLTKEVKEKETIKEVHNIEITTLKALYNMINYEALPIALQKMLNGSQQGLRNQVMLFLVPFLRNTLGLNIQNIKQMMTIWGSRCTPALSITYIEKEVDRIYSYGLTGPYGKYTTELTKAYGYWEFTTFERKNKIKIPNEIFEDFANISDCAIKIYLGMQLDSHLKSKNEFTKAKIIKLVNISEKTFRRNIDDLLAFGYVTKKRSNKKIKGEYIYYINPYFNATKGFTLLETATINLMLLQLTDGEIKLYTYLTHLVGNTKGPCTASQKYLAKKLGKAGHDSISKMTDSMDKKKFITKTTTKQQKVTHTTYNLNY